MSRLVSLSRSLLPSTLILIAAVSLVSTVFVAAILINNWQWTSWSFSALGEGGTISALFFNVGVALAAILIWLAAELMARKLQFANRAAARLSRSMLQFVSYCLLAVAIFPNDTMHGYHFMASRLLVITFMIYTLIAPRLLPNILSRRDQDRLYATAAAAAVACLCGYILGGYYFVFLEGVTGFLSILWLYFLCRFAEGKQNIPLKEERLLDAA